jgi:catechol 2,3-dioxygenase-like lactoylglutathione lyase family enzyme
MSITAFLHAAILVTDLELASHFYGQILGLTPIERDLKFPGIWYQVGAVQLHLIVQPEVVDDQIDTEKWGRNRHLAFAVEDLETVKTTLTTAGYSWQSSASGRPALFVHDPDGNTIELGQL